MHIIERAITEEYDEGGRLTSRTTVEKYGDDGPVLPNTADAMLDAIKELPLCEVEELFHMLCEDMKKNSPTTWAQEMISKNVKECKVVTQKEKSVLQALYDYMKSVAVTRNREAKTYKSDMWTIGVAQGYADCTDIVEKYIDRYKEVNPT